MFEQGQDCLATVARQSLPIDAVDMDLRDRAICSRYLAGETLSSIGRYFGLSIEGVRKIARKSGLDKTNAGMAVRKRTRVAPKRAKPVWERVYGCNSLLEFRDAIHTERMAFLQHRTNARRFDIQWELTLSEWVGLWRQSGKWDSRGQGPKKYGMSRIDTDRGFTAGNIRIARNAISLKRARARHATRQGMTGGSTPLRKSDVAIAT